MKGKGSKGKQPDFEQIQKALADEWQERLKKGTEAGEPASEQDEAPGSSAS